MKLLIAVCLVVSLSVMSNGSMAAPTTIERGRYLVEIAGCNDCHTAGYAQVMGELPDTQWLLGDVVGFSGPWGVSYAGNLRLRVADMSWPEWQARLNGGGLPPMPWPAVKAMTDEDQRAIYDFIRSLGAAGVPAPVAKGPGELITTPHIHFVPQPPEAIAQH